MKPSIGKFLILIPIIICLCFVGVWFYPSLGLRFNHSLWTVNKPLEYQMQVVETRPDGGPWRWNIRVKNGEVVSGLLLESDTHGKLENESWLDPTNLTIEQIFTIARERCAYRGFLDCGIEYDSHYHFPKSIYSYELISVQIESFTDCSKTPASCADS